MRAMPSISASARIRRASDQVEPSLAQGLAVIGVDVLAEQRDLDRAGRHELARFGQHRRRPAANIRRRAYRARRRRCRTCRSLPGSTGRPSRRARPAAPAGDRTCSRPGSRCRARRRPAGACRREDRGLALGLGQQLGQAMIGLRADHDVDRRLAAGDLLALGLGDAARDGDGEVAALGAALDLEVAQAAELGIDLLRGMLADVAGVQHDEVGLLGRRRPGHSRAAAGRRPCGRSRRRSSGTRRCG